MHFVQRILRNLEDWPDRPFAIEVHGSRLVSTEGRRLRALVEIARHALRSRGVKPGDRVVLIAPNSTRWIALDLAILAEGATVVPLYARQEPRELAGMIADADPRLVICADDALAAAVATAQVAMTEPPLPPAGEGRGEGTRHGPPDAPPPRPSPASREREIVLVSDLFTTVAPSGDAEPARPLASDHPVTIIYTSGSSGEPKGVITTVANVEHMLPVLDVKLRELSGVPGGSDRVFHYLPFCFAGSRMVLWGCLFRANGLLMSTSLENLAQEIQAARPEYFLNVPALLERIKTGVEKKIAERPYPVRAAYAQAIESWRRIRRGEGRRRDELIVLAAKRAIFRAIRKQIGEQLKGLICGSAPLPEEVQRWFSELVGIPVFQVYGLTETTAIVTIDRTDAVVPGRVGHAIRGCEIKLGEDGELLVRGPNLFAGYFRRDDASRAALTADGWFRTGDQCTLDERGNLAVIGRVKNLLVPTSGHNVAPEPLEERVLQSIPGVEQAVVIGHGRPFLSVIVTGAVDPGALDAGLATLNEGLPHYRRLRKAHVAKEKLTPENGLLTANQKLRRAAIERHFAADIERLYT